MQFKYLNYIVSNLERLGQQLNLKAILTVYEHGYTEIYPIKENTLGSGKPLTKKTLTKLLILAKDEGLSSELYGIIPKNLDFVSIKLGTTKLCWWNPPQKRRVILQDGIFEINIPGIIYILTDKRLNVKFFKTKQLTRETEIYNSLFPNTEGSSVCLGNVSLESSNKIDEIITNYEGYYWNSKFTENKKWFLTSIKKTLSKENGHVKYKVFLSSLH